MSNFRAERKWATSAAESAAYAAEQSFSSGDWSKAAASWMKAGVFTLRAISAARSEASEAGQRYTAARCEVQRLLVSARASASEASEAQARYKTAAIDEAAALAAIKELETALLSYRGKAVEALEKNFSPVA
jgi:hypothetical protein